MTRVRDRVAGWVRKRAYGREGGTKRKYVRRSFLK
jgi:hypothetical protein